MMATRATECEPLVSDAVGRVPFWRLRDRVLVVGYSPEIPGGVTTITRLLRDAMPVLDLHVAHRWYTPRWKAITFWLFSISTFIVRLVVAPPRVVQIIIASHGDAIRMLPFILLARGRGCNVCLHFHKNFAAIFAGYSPRIRGLVLRVWRLAGHYCFLSKRLRDEFRGYLDVEKAWVIPNPISEAWLQLPAVPYERRTHDLTFLGRWSPEKGNDDLLSAMRGLDATAGVRCDVYSDRGTGETRDNCVFHDWLAPNDVRQVLLDSKILLLPSRAEAYPTILLEAAACGTPFVATAIAGVQDIAEESRAGLLHDVGDAAAMREAITRLLTDRGLWLESSRNGRQWIESLSLSNIIPRWERFYAKLGVQIVQSSPPQQF